MIRTVAKWSGVALLYCAVAGGLFIAYLFFV